MQACDAAAGGPFDRSEWFDLLAERETGAVCVWAGGDNTPGTNVDKRGNGLEDAALNAPQDADPLTIMALKQDGQRLDSLTNWYSFVWSPQGICSQDHLLQIARNLRSKASRIVLAPLADESDLAQIDAPQPAQPAQPEFAQMGMASKLEWAFVQAGWSVQREPCDHNHVLYVGTRSFAQYWAERSGRMRTTLKRKAKKVQCTLFTQFDAQAWEQYAQVYEKSWKPAEGDPALLEKFARQEGAAGRLRLALAQHEGQTVAAQFWTVEKHQAYIHKLAHLEEFKNLSAGTTLSAFLFEQVIDRDKVELIDFGTGNDPYKRDWMEHDRPRYRLDCLNPSRPGAWLPLAKRKGRKLASIIRQG